MANELEKSKWVALIKQVNDAKVPIDWKMWSNLTGIGAITTVALFAGLVIIGAAKKKTV